MVHILNGDALTEKFPKEFFKDAIVVCRECLVDGPVTAHSLEDFWNIRANFIDTAFHSDNTSYYKKVVAEFERLQTYPKQEINLWFDFDLFCQVNMWFTIDYIVIHDITKDIYRVAPTLPHDQRWKGYGTAEKDDLLKSFANRIKLTSSDISLARELWKAYQQHDLSSLDQLASTTTAAFPFLRETCDAHIARYDGFMGRPQKRLREIVESGVKDFPSVFRDFSYTEGVYGFGDLQVKRILDHLEP
jgi:hypothetical protein